MLECLNSTSLTQCTLLHLMLCEVKEDQSQFAVVWAKEPPSIRGARGDPNATSSRMSDDVSATAGGVAPLSDTTSLVSPSSHLQPDVTGVVVEVVALRVAREASHHPFESVIRSLFATQLAERALA